MSSAKVGPVTSKPFLERIREGVVVADGAMGTMLYNRGIFLNRCFDELNVSSPDLVPIAATRVFVRRISLLARDRVRLHPDE